MTTAALTRTADRTDTDLANAAAQALELGAVPATVEVAVHQGFITLTGRAPWLSQKVLAERAVFDIDGVWGVKNQITVVPESVAGDVYRRVVDAVCRSGEFEARKLGVSIDGDVATLTGVVGSLRQREAAERAAAAATGIRLVDNRLAIEPIDDRGMLDEIC